MRLAPVQVARPWVGFVPFAPGEDPPRFFNQIFTLPLAPTFAPLMLVRLVKLPELLVDVTLVPGLVLQFLRQLFDASVHMRGLWPYRQKCFILPDALSLA